jgi:hypothetical protein
MRGDPLRDCNAPVCAPMWRSRVDLPMNLRSYFLVAALVGAALGAHATAAETAQPPATSLPKAEQAKVDINTAEIPALEAIPEIGTDFANAVVGGRPYKSVDDLERVLKIGPEKMAQLRQKVFASAVKPVPRSPAKEGPRPEGTKPPAINDGVAVDRKEVTERYDRTNKAPSSKKSEEKK